MAIPKKGSIDAVIGARIRSLRLHHGLTQKDLAREVGLTFQQIQKYETGANQVSPTRLLEFAGIFGVAASVLLGEVPSQDAGAQAFDAFVADLDAEAILMLKALRRVRHRKLRRQLAALVELIARLAQKPG